VLLPSDGGLDWRGRGPSKTRPAVASWEPACRHPCAHWHQCVERRPAAGTLCRFVQGDPGELCNRGGGFSVGLDLCYEGFISRHVVLDDDGEMGTCFFGYLAWEDHNELNYVLEGHEFGPAGTSNDTRDA
jgi:hypothetical protein